MKTLTDNNRYLFQPQRAVKISDPKGSFKYIIRDSKKLQFSGSSVSGRKSLSSMKFSQIREVSLKFKQLTFRITFVSAY